MSADFTDLAQLLVALHGVGQALQHHAERAARLARAHDVDVEAREHLAPRVERLRQRLAAAHVVAHALQQRGDRRRGREADEDLERAIERQARAQQRRELARHRQQLVARDRLRFEPAPASAALRRRRARRRAAPRRDACAICIGIRPWSRRRSTISLSLAASSSPTATSPGGAHGAVAVDRARSRRSRLRFARDAQDFFERGVARRAPCACRPRTSTPCLRAAPRP